MARRLAKHWDVSVTGTLAGGCCSLVYSGLNREGREVVLKVPVRGEEMTTGHRAARAFSGLGGVEILADDPESGSLLMPRLGQSLADAYGLDLEAERITASLTRRLHKATLAVDVRLDEYLFAELHSSALPGSPAFGLEEPIAELRAQLLATTDQEVLLHGDLHHFNILKCGEEWVAIDPKGVVGDPAFEPSSFLRNPYDRFPDDDLRDMQRRRIGIFSRELGLDPWRIWAWGLVANFLGCSWNRPTVLENHQFGAIQALWDLRDEYG